jgi:tRNA-dihydrouridine synthase B
VIAPQHNTPHTNPHIGQPLTIPSAAGGLALSSNLLLAPVANYCDLAFRLVCREQGGLGLACTDLLSPQGLLRGTARSLDIAATNEADSPVCMQLYGGDPEILAEGAIWAVEHGADVIDINMGCPVDKVTKKDGGSKLLCDPDRTVKIAERIAIAVEKQTKGRVPVTAKVRLGWDASCIVAPELARRLEKVGIRQITVHGRTTEQRFKGEVNHAGIREVVEAVDSIPVIGNGDVTTQEGVIQMMEKTGCAGVMIGRGSFSSPWIFRQGWAIQTTGNPGPEPDEAAKIAIIRRYFELMREYRDDSYALTHLSRRISWFGKKLGPCKPLKEAIRLAKEPDTVHRALDEFLAGGLRLWAEVDEDSGVLSAS